MTTDTDAFFVTDGHVEGLQASIILLAKRMGWNTTYKQLLCHKLIPMVDEWRVGAVSDGTAVEVITVMGMCDEGDEVSGS